MLRITRIIFYIILVLFILDINEFFQTKMEWFKSLIYYEILILPIPVLIMELKANKNISDPILRKAIPILTIIGLLYLNPLNILFFSETWKTQTVELINENNANHKVELQMKDRGALGYAKRNVEVYYLTDYFYIKLSEPYDKRNFLGHKWKRINEDKNELGLRK